MSWRTPPRAFARPVGNRFSEAFRAGRLVERDPMTRRTFLCVFEPLPWCAR